MPSLPFQLRCAMDKTLYVTDLDGTLIQDDATLMLTLTLSVKRGICRYLGRIGGSWIGESEA